MYRTVRYKYRACVGVRVRMYKYAQNFQFIVMLSEKNDTNVENRSTAAHHKNKTI